MLVSSFSASNQDADKKPQAVMIGNDNGGGSGDGNGNDEGGIGSGGGGEPPRLNTTHINIIV